MIIKVILIDKIDQLKENYKTEIHNSRLLLSPITAKFFIWRIICLFNLLYGITIIVKLYLIKAI